MTETNAIDDLVRVQLGHHFQAPDATPINAVSVLWMLQGDHPDLTVAQVLASFRALARVGCVRLLQHDGTDIGVVEGMSR